MSTSSINATATAESTISATELDTHEYATQAFQVMDAITIKLKRKRTPCSNECVCKFCQQFFSHRSTLLRHLRNAHPESKPFECDECGRRYERRIAFATHVRKHGAEQTSIASMANGSNDVAAGCVVERHTIADHSDETSYVVAGRELLS